jgi:hypothetical protein
MEGREAGTRGYDLAANYVAAQYALVGVAGRRRLYLMQRVPLLVGLQEVRKAPSASSAPTASRPPLVWRRPPATAQAQAFTQAVDAPLVFVGFGVVGSPRKAATIMAWT